MTTEIHTFAGAYDDVSVARGDFEAVRALHHDKTIDGFQAAVFTKREDGKVKIVDTVSTTRTAGAEWGLALGAILGVLFPAGVLFAALEGAGIGALAGNAAKGWTHWDLRAIGDALEAGETGVIVITRDTKMLDADDVLPHAKKSVKQVVEVDPNKLDALLADLGD